MFSQSQFNICKCLAFDPIQHLQSISRITNCGKCRMHTVQPHSQTYHKHVLHLYWLLKQPLHFASSLVQVYASIQLNIIYICGFEVWFSVLFFKKVKHKANGATVEKKNSHTHKYSQRARMRIPENEWLAINSLLVRHSTDGVQLQIPLLVINNELNSHLSLETWRITNIYLNKTASFTFFACFEQVFAQSLTQRKWEGIENPIFFSLSHFACARVQG